MFWTRRINTNPEPTGLGSEFENMLIAQHNEPGSSETMQNQGTGRDKTGADGAEGENPNTTESSERRKRIEAWSLTALALGSLVAAAALTRPRHQDPKPQKPTQLPITKTGGHDTKP